jgi:hypothetical protein
MGMSITWHTERGFGERSWRYSVVINDNKVEKMFIENGIPVQVTQFINTFIYICIYIYIYIFMYIYIYKYIYMYIYIYIYI